jgi:hypothetical protein
MKAQIIGHDIDPKVHREYFLGRRMGTGLIKLNNFYLRYQDFLSSVSPLCPGDGDVGAKRNNFLLLVMG